MKKLTNYFSKGELTLWGSSAGLILVSFFLFDRVNFMTLAASLIGTTSLIFNAKGNPIGQALMIVFRLLYGGISYTFSYFGEMITDLGMTGPMVLFALIFWLRNPHNGNHAEVAVNWLGNREFVCVYTLTVLWTLAAVEDISYLSVIICFVMFLVNDLYGFVSWKQMEKRQMATA